MGMYNGIVVPSVLYDSETCEINAKLRTKVEVFEMSCPRPIRRVTLQDKMRYEDIITGCGLKYKMSEKVIQSAMKWYGQFGHMGKMSGGR